MILQWCVALCELFLIIMLLLCECDLVIDSNIAVVSTQQQQQCYTCGSSITSINTAAAAVLYVS
jgi:hypothetical protein